MTKQAKKAGLSLQTRIAAAAMATAVGVLLVACALFTVEQWSGEPRGAGAKPKTRLVDLVASSG